MQQFEQSIENLVVLTFDLDSSEAICSPSHPSLTRFWIIDLTFTGN